MKTSNGRTMQQHQNNIKVLRLALNETPLNREQVVTLAVQALTEHSCVRNAGTTLRTTGARVMFAFEEKDRLAVFDEIKDRVYEVEDGRAVPQYCFFDAFETGARPLLPARKPKKIRRPA